MRFAPFVTHLFTLDHLPSPIKVFQIKHIITVNFYYTVQLPFWLIAIPQHLVHIHSNGDFD
jgi:hypothetical protein